MKDLLHTVETQDLTWLSSEQKEQAIEALEAGKVIYFPTYFFNKKDKDWIASSEAWLDKNSKNISYDYITQRLAGVNKKNSSSELEANLQLFMHDFAEFSLALVSDVLPWYAQDLTWGRTSFRPAAIEGRKTSKRKDDTRLHVDSFAATPVNGLRILRVFCNVNAFNEPRVWHLGETFPEVMAQFAGKISPYRPMLAKALKCLKATKSLRSAYDHYMLKLHDTMKLDDAYQASCEKQRVDFPAQSSWVVFTDQVSHAALSGQFLLEQTFYLPIHSLKKPEQSPYHQWQAIRELVL